MFAPPAFAQTAGQAAADSGVGQIIGLAPLFLVFIAFYFLMIRPQQKKAKEHAALLGSLRQGDKVLTSGGILGIVVGVKDKSVSIRSADTKLEVLKSAVTEITERSGAGAES